MYCGNNKNFYGLKDGMSIGTRYNCFRKGIGVGKNLPVDMNYTKKYSPIDERKMYCGKSKTLPENYDIMGNNLMCFHKGVGVGKSISAKEHAKKQRKKPKIKK